MQIERLGYFVEVARKRSINLASESLHISQQALSQSMHSLEKELGVSLFERSNKGIRLTDKGEEVLAAAEAITQRWEQLKLSLTDDRELEGSVRLLMAPFLETNFYVPLMAYLAKHYPKLTVQVHNVYPREATKLLETRQGDLALVSYMEANRRHLEEQAESLQLIFLMAQKLDIWVSKSSPLAHRSVVSMTELRDQLFIMERAEDREQFMLVRVLEHYQCEHWQMVNSLYSMQKMVADGLGVTFMMDCSPIVAECQGQIVRLQLEEEIFVKVGVWVEKDRLDDPLIKAVLKGLPADGAAIGNKQ